MTFAIDVLSFSVLQWVTFAFGVALWVHFKDRQRLGEVLRGTAGVSSPAAAVAVLVVDGLIAVALVVAPLVGAATAFAYLSVITFYFWVRSRQGFRIPDCGCSATAKAVDAKFFGRNAVLIASSGVVAFRFAAGDAVTWPWMALTAVTLLSSFAVAQTKLKESAGEGAEHEGRAAPVASTSRRTFLRLTSAALGGAAFLVSRPVQALAVQGRRSGKVGRTRELLDGAEARAAVDAVRAGFPALAEVERLVPGATAIEWRSATASRLEYKSGEGKIVFTEVKALILGEGSTLAGILVRMAGVSMPRVDDVEIGVEERAQLMFPSGKQQKTLLLSPDGSQTIQWTEAKTEWPTALPSADQPCSPPVLTCSPGVTGTCIFGCACRHVICTANQVCKGSHPLEPYYLRHCGDCDFCSDTPCPPLCGCPLGLPCCGIFGFGGCDSPDCLVEIMANCISGSR